MLGASALHDVWRGLVPVGTRYPKRLLIGFSLGVALPSRHRCRISCHAAKPDLWEQTVSQPDTFRLYSGYIADIAIEEADQLNEYNVDKIVVVFGGHPFLLARRLLQIARTLRWWAAVRYGDTIFGKKDTNFTNFKKLRRALVRLGPIAQAVSSRPVYEARLRPNGKLVAMKVQRPGVMAAISLDLFLLHKLAGFAKSFLKLNADLPLTGALWILKGLLTSALQVCSKKLFGSLPNVLVPEMYLELTSHRVLVMEWIDFERAVLKGQGLSEINDLRLVEVGVFCSLTQLLDSDFSHVDTHPGNLLRTPDGKLAYLDFGMMGQMKENLRDKLIKASVHLVDREFDSLVADFVTLGLLPPTVEKGEVSKALTRTNFGSVLLLSSH